MKISVVTVGKIKERYLTEGIAEYRKRLTPYCRLEILEVAEERMPENPSLAQKEQALAREGERILKYLCPESYFVALDIAGSLLSSEELSRKIDSLALSGQSNLTFVVGGAFGLSSKVTDRAKARLSFSKMTFTHQMIRLILLEQVYRAFKISRGEKYHW